MTTVKMTGKSGTRYDFLLVQRGQMPSCAGLYAMFAAKFVGPLGQATWQYSSVYVGKAADLDERVGAGLFAHHKVFDALVSGATHVGCLPLQGVKQSQIDAYERDLIDGNPHLLNGRATQFGQKAS